MKKALYIVIPLLLMFYLVAITLMPRTNNQKQKSKGEVLFTQNPETIPPEIPLDHGKEAFDCKSCHDCEYPTKENPCLKLCPRGNMSSVFHSPDEGPDVVVIKDMAENYSEVVFSHRVHSQMAQITTGCTGCHHYNTTGPVLNCRKCHEEMRSRDDVSIPDMKAAYHLQCLNCHKQWSHEDGCNTQCHTPKGSNVQSKNDETIKSISGKVHPSLNEPQKIVKETNSDKGKLVTFYHNEHTQLFKITCNKCHSQDNCINCHDKKPDKSKAQKTFEESHTRCSSCHSTDNCKKCHNDSEMGPFNHAKSTGWALKSYHSRLACSKCHGNSMPKKLNTNCTNCHKNFTPGNFDHNVIGIVFSEAHKDIECKTCHLNMDFTKTPVCKECHDDKSFPKDSPGIKGSKK